MRQRSNPQINTYGDLLPEWKHKLIIQRALARGVPPGDLDEVQQEVILAVLSYQHDPSKGATEKSALYVVIDRQISMFQRTHARRVGLQERYRSEQTTTCESTPRTDTQVAFERRLDIRSIISQLAALEQSVCAGLAEGMPISALVASLGITRYEMDRIIGRIQQRFRQAGLDQGLYV